jgi:hypothetical protein
MMPPLRLLKSLFAFPLFLSLVEQARLAGNAHSVQLSVYRLVVQVNNLSMDGNDA